MIIRLILFLALNFGALAIGGLFTSKGVPSDWYIELNKAPWTPPGWVFGTAWTIIMICFAIYSTYLWPVSENKNLFIGLYVFQLILNIGWNPTFFYYHNVLGALLMISGLTALIGFMLFFYLPELKFKSLLIVPYLIWLIIATSLNAFIWLEN
ncbi:MAG: tryptophan-rich sensory protein [Cyclobacteriaceae bacterium]|nr:tryptophan-rich sensory protein [Cyclobacteriaceae bacterium]